MIFDNDTRGQQLVTELKEWVSLRDRNLEYNIRADGSIRVIGFTRISGRRLLCTANDFGKTASFTMDTSKDRNVEIDFHDDIGWKPVTDKSCTKIALIELIKETFNGSIQIIDMHDVGSTNVIQLKATTAVAISNSFVRAVLHCSSVIDISFTRTYCNITMARSSNMIGGLAHIGSTTGFRSTRRNQRNGACKTNRRRVPYV